jgi:hypothetical protein
MFDTVSAFGRLLNTILSAEGMVGAFGKNRVWQAKIVEKLTKVKNRYLK